MAKLEAPFPTSEVIKMETWPSPTPRPKPYSTREPTPTHNSHNTQSTIVKQIHFSLCKAALSPARHALEDTSHLTQPKIDAGDASLI